MSDVGVVSPSWIALMRVSLVIVAVEALVVEESILSSWRKIVVVVVVDAVVMIVLS